ncbi:MAG: DUF1640 domain-containing protein [Chitinophagaceae bacterium]|nr:DUF1640 domain-containing protein [Chitinophagaceae bacterium]
MKKLFVNMLTVKSTFKLFDVVNRHFHNDHDSRLFISEVEEIMDSKVDLKMNDFTTKKDLEEHRVATKQDYLELRSEVKQDIAEFKAEVKLEISEFKAEMKQEISEFKAEMKQDFSDLKSDLYAKFNTLDNSIHLNLANTSMIQERTQKEHLKWMMGFMIAILGIAMALIKLI